MADCQHLIISDNPSKFNTNCDKLTDNLSNIANAYNLGLDYMSKKYTDIQAFYLSDGKSLFHPGKIEQNLKTLFRYGPNKVSMAYNDLYYNKRLTLLKSFTHSDLLEGIPILSTPLININMLKAFGAMSNQVKPEFMWLEFYSRITERAVALHLPQVLEDRQE